MIARCSALLVFLSLLSWGDAQAKDKQKVIILNLKVAGVEAEEAKTIKETLGGVLAKSVANLGHEVISPADIQAMMGLERLKDLVGCQSDTACLTELGGALGADLLVGGSVGKLGDTYSLTLSLVDNNEAKAKGRFQGTAGTAAALTGTVQRGVAVLFKRKKEVRTTGMLLIKTEPPGAALFLDGKPIGQSPQTLNADAGDHEIKASIDDLVGTEQALVNPSKVTRVMIRLTSPPVAIRVITYPSDATLYLDDEKLGITPYIGESVPSGKRVLRAEMDGYVSAEEAVVLDHAKYQASGQEPFAYELRLRRRWPLEPGLVVGATGSLFNADGYKLKDGFGPTVELTVDFVDYLQLGFEYTDPDSKAVNFRTYFTRDGFEIGLVLKGAWFVNRTNDGDEFSDDPPFSVGGGLTFGESIALPVGRIGIRVETMLMLQGFDVPVIPVHAGLYWRMR